MSHQNLSFHDIEQKIRSLPIQPSKESPLDLRPFPEKGLFQILPILTIDPLGFYCNGMKLAKPNQHAYQIGKFFLESGEYAHVKKITLIKALYSTPDHPSNRLIECRSKNLIKALSRARRRFNAICNKDREPWIEWLPSNQERRTYQLYKLTQSYLKSKELEGRSLNRGLDIVSDRSAH